MNRRKFLTTSAAGAGLSAAASLTLPLAAADAAPKPSPVQSKQTKGSYQDRIKPITSTERLQRIERARELMAREKMDAMLIEPGTTLEYYTGVRWWRSERLFAMVLPRKGDPFYITPKFEEDRTREQTGSTKVLTWEEHESPYRLIRQALTESGVAAGTVGVEETTRFFVTDNLAREAGALHLVDATPVTAGCRSVKSAHELELMQIANDITREVFLASLSRLKEGMREQEFAGIISDLYREHGVSGGALVLFGEASALPHGSIEDHTLREGQTVLIDGGCGVEGYRSDVTRTTVFGKPSETMRSVWAIVRRAQDAALKAARPGVPAGQIDEAARKIITDAGYGPDYRYFTHRLGHGIGMEGHEWYYLVRGSTRPLEAGNTFSDEPGIYIPGEFGIRLEDELVITPDGAYLMLPQAASLEQIFS